MVTGLFCHYLPIYKDRNGVYCSTTLTNDVFKRYFRVVDKLIVADRVYQINETYQEAHQEPITLENLVIEEFPNLSSGRGFVFEKTNSKKRIDILVKKSDLIFIRGGIIANLASSSARRQHKAYLVESAGCAWDEYWNYSFLGKLLAPWMEFSSKKNTKYASHVVYVTKNWLQKRYPTAGVSEYASDVVLDRIDSKVLVERLTKLKNFDSQKTIVIGTTGGIGNKAKGQQFVMRAMRKLKDRYDLRYELVGGGDDSYLHSEAKRNGVLDRVDFKGQLTHDEVLEWLSSIDIYIQPSMQEGLPRALVEAMSRACPAVGSTTGGIPELLDSETLFKRGKVSSLTQVLDRVLQSNLEEFAINNFNKSKEYQISVVDEKRDRLNREYRDFVLGGKN